MQDISNTDIVELEEIRADLPVNDKNRAIVEAARGTFDRANNTLDITSAMRIVSDNGMTALFQSADIDTFRKPTLIRLRRSFRTRFLVFRSTARAPATDRLGCHPLGCITKESNDSI